LKPVQLFFKNLFGSLFNTKCCICGCVKSCLKDGEIMCENCAKQFEFYTNKEHKIFDGVIINSLIKYNDFSKKVVRKLKFQYKKDLSKTLARLVCENFLKDNDFVLVPVPAHKARLNKYGFNHTQVICEEIKKLKGCKINNKILLKSRETLTQHFLNQEQRFKNVQNSFKINSDNYNNENIFIIDDITTTGATLEEIIKAFKKENINKIACLTIFK